MFFSQIAAGGLSAAFFGKWTMKVGLRRSMLTGASIFGAGFLLSGAGVLNHNIPMLYAGNCERLFCCYFELKNVTFLFFLHAVLCGIGYGCAYTPPIQALLEWFPDKKGLASGIVIAGFGSGALFFSPMMNKLMAAYSVIPEYLGKSAETVTEGGKLFAKVGGDLKEVVYATGADLAKLPYENLAEGFYVVGTGNTGKQDSKTRVSLAALTATIINLRCGGGPFHHGLDLRRDDLHLCHFLEEAPS